MVSVFQIRNMPLLTLRVSEIPFFNFISRSRNLPQFRVSLPIDRHPSCLSLSASPFPIYDSEKPPTDEQPFEHSFEVSYFINTFGWTPEEVAISKAKTKYLRFKTPEKPERILAFFKEHGFNMTQISRIVKFFPMVLLSDPEKLLPRIEFLSSLGLSRTEIAVVVTKVPDILRRSLEMVLIPAFNLMRSLVDSDNEAVEMVKHNPAILIRKPEEDNIQILLEAGVPRANIVTTMSWRRGHLPIPDSLKKNMVEKVKGMGFDPSTMKFLYALQAFRTHSKPKWDDKVRVLKKYGWSDRDILLAFEKNPRFIMSSKEKIDGVLDFLVNKVGIEATDVANCPLIFQFSLEKRIVPRYLVYRSMMETGLCKRKNSILTLCHFSDDQFLSKFMKEAPELYNYYKEMLNIKK